jgi:hypothetical protein
MKIFLSILPLLLLSGCAKTEGLTAVPNGGFLPTNVAPAALTQVITYEDLNRSGEQISSISEIENSRDQIKLRVVTGDSESIFTLTGQSGNWQIVDVQ